MHRVEDLAQTKNRYEIHGVVEDLNNQHSFANWPLLSSCCAGHHPSKGLKPGMWSNFTWSCLTQAQSNDIIHFSLEAEVQVKSMYLGEQENIFAFSLKKFWLCNYFNKDWTAELFPSDTTLFLTLNIFSGSLLSKPTSSFKWLIWNQLPIMNL